VTHEPKTDMAIASREIVVQGQLVEVREAGQGEPLVFLHGGGVIEGVDFLAALADQFHVCAPLFPGYGRSEPNVSLTSREAVSDHLRDVLDALGVGTTHLVGHSLGGWRAANFAAQYPGRVDRLVLASPFGLNVPDHPIFNMMAATPEERREVLTSDPKVWVGRIPTGPDPAFDEARAKEQQAMGRFSPGPADAALPATLAMISAETLVLWGEGDRLIPVAHAAEWVKLLPSATLRTFEGAGHLLFHERPDAVEAIADFLQSPTEHR
jgi:pimeloyl-ACP methyl ester carboxylesterase